MDIQKRAIAIMAHGPDRVLVDGDFGVASKQARDVYRINPDIIFIRNDGWSLGAPKFLESTAYDLWKNEWSGFLKKPDITAHPIAYYKQL